MGRTQAKIETLVDILAGPLCALGSISTVRH